MTDEPKQSGVARLRTKNGHIMLVPYSGTKAECDKQIADKAAEFDAVLEDGEGPEAA